MVASFCPHWQGPTPHLCVPIPHRCARHSLGANVLLRLFGNPGATPETFGTPLPLLQDAAQQQRELADHRCGWGMGTRGWDRVRQVRGLGEGEEAEQ